MKTKNNLLSTLNQDRKPRTDGRFIFYPSSNPASISKWRKWIDGLIRTEANEGLKQLRKKNYKDAALRFELASSIALNKFTVLDDMKLPY